MKFNIEQDEMTGDYGLIPIGCEGFNAFWTGNGIFHDVFEHHFENNHKYFMGDYALNRGGECAAMGAFMYYCEQLGVSNRPLSSYHYFMDSARRENEDAFIEAIQYDGGDEFTRELMCNVPYQRPIETGDLEYQVRDMYNTLKKLQVSSNYPVECQAIKDSITLGKLQNLYRWGYRMAEKLVPDNWENRNTCMKFIDFWQEWCKNNSAEDLAGNRLEITLNKVKGLISWKAYLILDGRIKNTYLIYESI